ncbi:MAG: GH3 auxin-responsive promoter family protein [Elusimicrobiota bacterium]|nr:GH3 auxin-responsive promoter family protein [Elusimicrobiota bacterium]
MTQKALVRLCNFLLFISSARARFALRRASFDIRLAQEKLLGEILRRNKGTEFGGEHGFAGISGSEQYRSRVPLRDYDAFADRISAIASGTGNALTAEPVLRLLPTSGSAAPTKHIPFTSYLKSRFQTAIDAWLFDLFAAHPGLFSGKAYWQITPPARSPDTGASAALEGFEDDSEYLGPVARLLSRFLLAVPPEVAQLCAIDDFRYATLLFLLRERDLALISVWNPSFLSLLLAPVRDWSGSLISDIEKGALSLPGGGQLPPGLAARLRPDPARAAELSRLFAASPFSYEKIWPGLRLISCWCDAAAAPQAARLAALFPGVSVQPKGLIATEAFVSLPLEGFTGHALAVNSHFFEFLPAGGASPKFAWELAVGERYGVVVTNGAGLYRYRLHDIVEVTGFYNEIPLLKFIGKEDRVSDIAGEKISEQHAARLLESLFRAAELSPAFSLVAPEREGEETFYCLFAELDPAGEAAALRADLAGRFEKGLSENFHYDYCRRLGQLGPARVFAITKGLAGAAETYLACSAAAGRKLGGIKPPALENTMGWSSRFKGRYLPQGSGAGAAPVPAGGQR